jgi:hypothetical protein
MIDKLTKKQKAKLEVYKNKWLDIGLSTKNISNEEAVKIIHNLYEKLLDKPKVPVVVLDSPLQCWIAVCMFSGNQVENQVVNQVWNQVENQVVNQVGNQVWNQVENQVVNQVRNQVRNQVGSGIRSGIRSRIRSGIRSGIRSRIRS